MKPDTEAFDWQGLEAAAAAQIVAAVRRVRAEYPDEHVYGAMFHEFYGDSSVIYWPNLTVGTEEVLAQAVARYLEKRPGKDADDDLVREFRWWGPNLWDVPGGLGARAVIPGDSEDAWGNRCLATVAPGDEDAWDALYHRFLHVFPRAAKKAAEQLVREGVVGEDFIAIAADGDVDLIPLSLTEEQYARHFPPLRDKVAEERARLAGLPPAQRATEVVPRAVDALADDASRPRLPLSEYAALVRELGEAAVPALLDVVTGRARGEPFEAIMLLADINHSAPAVIEALERVMTDEQANLPARGWAAAALARLGRMDLIVRHAARLPVEAVARGLADPYTGWRDYGKHGPLDYAPLEAALRQHPEFAAAVAEILRPERGFCKIDASEVTAARAGLDSSWPFIREHARAVLEAWETR
jgi:hypothetical protein